MFVLVIFLLIALSNGDFLSQEKCNTITNLEKIDSGTQKQVYSGLYNNKQIIVKTMIGPMENIFKAIKANPNSSEAYFCMAYMEQEKENFDKAITYFEKAFAIKPDDSGRWNNLGNCHDRINQHEQAIQAYSQALLLDENYIAALYNRGNAYSKLAKDELAYADLTKAIELDENFYQAYYNRGTLLKRMGKVTESEQDLAKAKAFAQAELEQKTH